MVDTTATQDTRRVAEQPAATPSPTPPTRPARRNLRKWRARFVVLLLLAAAGYLGVQVSQGQAAEAAQIDVGDVALTAQIVPIETARPGQITAVNIAAEQRVTAGQRIGTIQVTTTNAQGRPVVSTLNLTAPREGIVVDNPVTVGSTLQPGEPFAELYDPTKLMFVAQLPLEDLAEIGPGMVATLKAEGLQRSVRVTVQRVVPRVGDNQSDVAPGHMKMVMVPRTAEDVAGLMPGLRFTGTVDTTTGPAGDSRLVSMGR